MIIYSVTTLLLFGQLDWRLAALVVVWMVLFVDRPALSADHA